MNAIGIFGGTFDPVHNGHMAIGKAAVETYGLDALYVMPTYTPPHKGICIPHHHRFAMVTLATQDERKMVPYANPSYSFAVDEVRSFQRKHPGATIYYVMGMDAYLDLEKWHEPQELVKLCEFVVSHRPGYDKTNIPTNAFYSSIAPTTRFITQIHMPISASDIRRGLSKGDPISTYLINPRVMNYINKTGLYDANNGHY